MKANEKALQIHPVSENGSLDSNTTLLPVTRVECILENDTDNQIVFQRPITSMNEALVLTDITPTSPETESKATKLELDKTKLYNQLKEAIFEGVYPIGSLYISTRTDINNPADVLGFGTWERIQGKFLVAAGTSTDAEDTSSTFTLGQTGGYSTTHLITHTHSISDTIVTVNDKNPMKFDIDCRRLQGNQKVVELRNVSGCEVTESEYSPDIAALDYNNNHYMGRWTVDLKHGHTTDAHTHTLGNSGTVDTTNSYNLPPYLVVNIWKRIADN